MRYSTRFFVFNCQADQAIYLTKDQGRDRVSINYFKIIIKQIEQIDERSLGRRKKARFV